MRGRRQQELRPAVLVCAAREAQAQRKRLFRVAFNPRRDGDRLQHEAQRREGAGRDKDAVFGAALEQPLPGEDPVPAFEPLPSLAALTVQTH